MISTTAKVSPQATQNFMNLLLLDLLQRAHGHRCIFELKGPFKVCIPFATLLSAQLQCVWSVKTVRRDKTGPQPPARSRCGCVLQPNGQFPITHPYCACPWRTDHYSLMPKCILKSSHAGLLLGLVLIHFPLWKTVHPD